MARFPKKDVFDMREAVRDSVRDSYGRNRLFEADEDAAVKATEDRETQENDSIDSQVDKYLAEYEGEAKGGGGDEPKQEGKRHLKSLIARLLREAGEDEDEDAPDAPGDEDKEGDVTSEPGKMDADQLDMSTFTSSVVRLVENYDSILEVKNTILRRARNFIVKNYEESAAKQFDDHLSEEHGMEIGKSKQDRTEEFEAPRAGAAGPMGGAGGAGAPA